MISKFTIAKIMEDARVEDVVGEYVVLKKRGSNLLGNCPFHNEKTPSFTVTPAKNFYKCFGCGKSGNAVTFLMDHAQMTYVEALRHLAKKYNIEIEEITTEVSNEEKEKQSLAESIYIANNAAQKFYSNFLLNTEEGGIGLAYFKERGFDKATIEKFQLGFSPDGQEVFTKYAIANSFQKDILIKAGLTSEKEYGTRDFFRNRAMFPIHSLTGKVLGFGARILKKDEKAPKYVNTAENEVYHKSKVLYGAFFAKQAVRKMDECYLVEGYTDVISMHGAGIENVMASSGTALTIDQIRLVKRMTNNITMLYDGDAAGIKAALRGTDMILEEGMNVRIVMLPDQEDPDSFVSKKGAEGFLDFVKTNRKDLILFKTSLFAKEAAGDPIKKSELIKDIITSISKIPDPIQRSVYCKELAGHFDMQEQIITVEVNKIRRKKTDTTETPNYTTDEKNVLETEHQKQTEQATSNTIELLERDVLRLFLEYGSWEIFVDENTKIHAVNYLTDELEGIEISTPALQKLYALIVENTGSNLINNESYYTTHPDPEISTTAIQLLSSKYSISENWEKKFKIFVPEKKHIFIRDIESAVIRLKQYHIFNQLKMIEAKLKAEQAKPEEEQNLEEILKLLTAHSTIMKQKKDFALASKTVIYNPNT